MEPQTRVAGAGPGLDLGQRFQWQSTAGEQEGPDNRGVTKEEDDERKLS